MPNKIENPLCGVANCQFNGKDGCVFIKIFEIMKARGTGRNSDGRIFLKTSLCGDLQRAEAALDEFFPPGGTKPLDPSVLDAEVAKTLILKIPDTEE